MRVPGFIVRSKDGKYLSRTFHWVDHANSSEAWVHKIEKLRLAGEWLMEADLFIHATFEDENVKVLPMDCAVPKSRFLVAY